MNNLVRIVAVLFANAVVVGCTSSVAPEVHLVPSGYEGPLIVCYNQPAQPALPHSGDSLVYDFRSSNVLRTSSPLRTGSGSFDSFQYYYVDAAGHRSRIRKVDNWEALRRRPPEEACLIVTAGLVGKEFVSEFLSSSRHFDRNEARSLRLTDSLMQGDTVSGSMSGRQPAKMPR